MPYRLTHLRLVDPVSTRSFTGRRPVSLWRAALSAAEETLHGGPLATPWLQLFRAHLSCSDGEMLRWRGDLGGNTEMRRVYSALYGRYFARALLGSELGITDFISLDGDITLPNGVTVKRIHGGDIPDWIAWDPRAGAYILSEAKGRLTGSQPRFLNGTPNCIQLAKAQFGRVVVKSHSDGVIPTRNWVAANLWSTDARRRQPISLLWDPPDDGATFTDNEVRRHADAIRKYRIRAMTERLGTPVLTVRISTKPSHDPESSAILEMADDNPLSPTEHYSRESHEGDYLAATITPLGIRPIRNASDLRDAQMLKEGGDMIEEPAMILGLARGEQQITGLAKRPWVSAHGIASPDGLSLFNLKDLEIQEA